MPILKARRTDVFTAHLGDFEYADCNGRKRFLGESEYRQLGLGSLTDFRGRGKTDDEIVEELQKRFDPHNGRVIYYAECLKTLGTFVAVEKIKNSLCFESFLAREQTTLITPI